MKHRPPIGSSWRILAHAVRGDRSVDLYSADHDGGPPYLGERGRVPFPTVFDELVIRAGTRTMIHVEQMDTRTWFVQLGDEKRMVTVKRDGSVVVGDVYK